MKKFLTAILTVVAILFATSCKKEELRKATIILTNDITYLGCGYLLQFDDGELVKPNYLPAAYQHDKIQVMVKYNHSGVVDTCNYGPKLYDLVLIDHIELAKK